MNSNCDKLCNFGCYSWLSAVGGSDCAVHSYTTHIWSPCNKTSSTSGGHQDSCPSSHQVSPSQACPGPWTSSSFSSCCPLLQDPFLTSTRCWSNITNRCHLSEQPQPTGIASTWYAVLGFGGWTLVPIQCCNQLAGLPWPQAKRYRVSTTSFLTQLKEVIVQEVSKPQRTCPDNRGRMWHSAEISNISLSTKTKHWTLGPCFPKGRSLVTSQAQTQNSPLIGHKKYQMPPSGNATSVGMGLPRP